MFLNYLFGGAFLLAAVAICVCYTCVPVVSSFFAYLEYAIFIEYSSVECFVSEILFWVEFVFVSMLVSCIVSLYELRVACSCVNCLFSYAARVVVVVYPSVSCVM